MNKDLVRGLRDSLPVSLSTAAYGGVLGVLAAQKGVTLGELILMDLTIFAGSAEFVMIEMWEHPLPIIEMTLAVLIINLRYGLIGASLRDLFESSSLALRALFMHLCADENWAMTMAAAKRGKVTPWHLLGGGICMVTIWLTGTVLGQQLGALIPDPEALALDFCFVAVFTALAMGFWRGKHDLVPWIVAAALASLADALLPGKWFILIGSVAGAATAALMPEPKETDAEETADVKEVAA